MPKKLKTSFLGTTRKLPKKEDLDKQGPKAAKNMKGGCLFSFKYNSTTATDPNPFIIMISPRWTAKKGGTYFTGVNLNDIGAAARDSITSEFGHLPVGSVSFADIRVATDDPGCCVRTYNVRNVRALHKVEV